MTRINSGSYSANGQDKYIETAGPSQSASLLLRELVAHLRDNRTQLREEWARRITEAKLLTAMTKDEIFAEATSVYNNYVEHWRLARSRPCRLTRTTCLNASSPGVSRPMKWLELCSCCAMSSPVLYSRNIRLTSQSLTASPGHSALEKGASRRL